ncbi:MAG: PD-(D/E)XK nuclease family protein [Zetaproteobacteria bacterium]|nr:PD-(D/E)XK nuclease family protein [Zetaproteobacteria bacterium]
MRATDPLILFPIQWIDEAQLIHQLTEETLLITQTTALANDWKRRIALEKRARETSNASRNHVCETPHVTDWQTWIQEIVLSCLEIPTPLTPLQEHYLWLEIIEHDLRQNNIEFTPAAISQLANQALSAYQMIVDYEIPPSELASHQQHDGCAALLRWLTPVQQQFPPRQPLSCKRTLAAHLVDALLESASMVTMVKMKYDTLVIDQIEYLPPKHQQLLKKLYAAGIVLVSYREHINNTARKIEQFHDQASETSAIAKKIAAIIRHHPHANIAVLCADRDQQRMRSYAQKIHLHCNPDHIFLPEFQHHPQVSIHGQTLIEEPLIQQLWSLFELIQNPVIQQKRLFTLLMAPYLQGDANEQQERIALDQRLRKQNRYQFNIQSLQTMPGMADKMPQLLRILNTLKRWERSPRPASDWAKEIQQNLQRMGVPTLAFDDDESIDIYNQFLDALAKLAELDHLQKELSFSQALQALKRCCASPVRYMQRLYPNIRVMPLEEGLGMRFDYAFITQMDDRNFPAKKHNHPLLPNALLRQHQVASAERDFTIKQSQRFWQQTHAIAPSVLYSFCHFDNGLALLPSSFLPFVDSSNHDHEKSAKAVDPSEQLLPPSTQLVPFTATPPSPQLLNGILKGGTYLLRHQALCPFKGFAYGQLQCQPLEITEAGILPRQKGSILHLAMFHFWQQLGTQAQLIAQMQEESLLQKTIQQAIVYAFSQLKFPLQSELQAIETERLQQVILDWIPYEINRPPFQIKALESEWTLTIPTERGLVPMTMIIDRIDQDSMGNIIIIDYKTGKKNSSKNWLGDRLKDPQLPLYAMSEYWGHSAQINNNTPVHAIAYARIRSGEMGLEGLAYEDLSIAGIDTYQAKGELPQSWDELKAMWQTQLSELALEILEGVCDVNPMPGACEQCGLDALCRIQEMGFNDHTTSDNNLSERTDE